MAKSRGRRLKKAEGVEFSIDDQPEVQEKSVDQGITKEENSGNGELKSTFFGLVDSNEIDYFKQAESTLNINSFETDEEREGFVSSVLEEARGKELKLVTNQICSKLMERLILIGKDFQIKLIFKQLQGHFFALSIHKYSSHVLETLLVRIASLVEKEIIGEEEEVDDEIDENPLAGVTVEHMFLSMLNELKPQLNTLITNQYGSHVVRLIILIISGKELPSSTLSNSTLRSKKSKIARKMIEIKDNEIFNRSFQIPSSFKAQIGEFVKSILNNKDTKAMRSLAIDKIASPVLQLLLQVEGIVDRERSMWHLIFLSDKLPKDSQEEAFVEYLLSDSVGSHFLESLIKGTGVRLNYIERLYQLYMKERILKLCKRSTTGVFIVQALLHKLKSVEVKFILDQIIPELSNLLSINDNQNLELSTNVIDASIEQKNYQRDEIIQQLFLKFTPNFDYQNYENNDNDLKENPNPELFENILGLSRSTLGNTRDDWPTAEERRRSLLLEKLMQYDFGFVVCVWYNLLQMPSTRFIQMCLHGVFSHVIENSLVIQPNEQKPMSILRKRVLNLFTSNISTLAVNSYGSHIVDKLWDFTIGHNMHKDRIATELSSKSKVVKDSIYGKLVWKNWSMELFLRKKYDWKQLVKQQEIEFGNVQVKPIDLKMQQLNEKANPNSTPLQGNKLKNNYQDGGDSGRPFKKQNRGRNRN